MQKSEKWEDHWAEKVYITYPEATQSGTHTNLGRRWGLGENLCFRGFMLGLSDSGWWKWQEGVSTAFLHSINTSRMVIMCQAQCWALRIHNGEHGSWWNLKAIPPKFTITGPCLHSTTPTHAHTYTVLMTFAGGSKSRKAIPGYCWLQRVPAQLCWSLTLKHGRPLF